MRYTSYNQNELEEHFESLKKQITTLGKMHLKKSHTDSVKLWNRIYDEMAKAVLETRTYLKSPLFTIDVYPDKNQFVIQLHKRICTLFFGFIATSSEYEIIIQDLNSMFNYYGLEIVEELGKQTYSERKSCKTHRIYAVKFVEKT